MNNRQRRRILRASRNAHERRTRRIQRWRLLPVWNHEEPDGPDRHAPDGSKPDDSTEFRSSRR